MSINFNYFCHQTNKTNASIVCTILRPALLFPLALDIYAQPKFIVIDIFAVPKCAFRALTHTCAKWQTAKDERRKKKNINPNYYLCSKKLRTSEKGKVIRGGAKKSSFCLFSCPQWYSLIRSFLDLFEDCATVSFKFFFFCKMKATPTKTRAKKKRMFSVSNGEHSWAFCSSSPRLLIHLNQLFSAFQFRFRQHFRLRRNVVLVSVFDPHAFLPIIIWRLAD